MVTSPPIKVILLLVCHVILQPTFLVPCRQRGNVPANHQAPTLCPHGNLKKGSSSSQSCSAEFPPTQAACSGDPPFPETSLLTSLGSFPISPRTEEWDVSLTFPSNTVPRPLCFYFPSQPLALSALECFLQQLSGCPFSLPPFHGGLVH